MPEEDGTEHDRRVDDPIVPLAVGVIAGAVDGVDDHHNGNENKNQHDNAHSGVVIIRVTGGIGAAVVQIAQAVVVYIKTVNLAEQIDDPFAGLSALDVVIKAAVHKAGDLTVSHGVVRTHSQVGVLG